MNESLEVQPIHLFNSIDEEIIEKKNTLATPHVKPSNIYPNKPRYPQHSRDHH
jgi:hypothetical protein